MPQALGEYARIIQYAILVLYLNTICYEAIVIFNIKRNLLAAENRTRCRRYADRAEDVNSFHLAIYWIEKHRQYCLIAARKQCPNIGNLHKPTEQV